MTIIISTENSLVTSSHTVLDSQGNIVESREQQMMSLIHDHGNPSGNGEHIDNLHEIALLIEKGLDIHYDRDYFLWYSCYKGKLSLVKLFVEQGLLVNGFNNQPLRMAVQGNCDIMTIKYLVSKGADVTCCANDPLRMAARNGNLTIVKYLLANGADLLSNNWEIFHLGRLSQNQEMMAYLHDIKNIINDCDIDVIRFRAQKELITEFGENFFDFDDSYETSV